MLTVARVLIFCIVLFFYLHIQFHLKTGDELEVYELDSPSKETLEEICDVRQPARLTFQAEQLSSRLLSAGDTYGAFDVKVRDAKGTLEEDEDPYVPLRLDEALKVVENDTQSRYVIESNSEYLEETGLAKTFRAADPFLRPYMVASCRYDYTTASAGTNTPFRYNLDNRTYIAALSGKLTIKLSPPKASRYLYPVKDYCNFEFRSPVNPWNPQAQYKPDFDKAKCLDVVLEPGMALFVPARWWYSLQFTDTNTHVAVFRYGTYMSLLANAPHMIMWALQAQNVQHRMAMELGDSSMCSEDSLLPPSVSNHVSQEPASGAERQSAQTSQSTEISRGPNQQPAAATRAATVIEPATSSPFKSGDKSATEINVGSATGIVGQSSNFFPAPESTSIPEASTASSVANTSVPNAATVA